MEMRLDAVIGDMLYQKTGAHLIPKCIYSHANTNLPIVPAPIFGAPEDGGSADTHSTAQAHRENAYFVHFFNNEGVFA